MTTNTTKPAEGDKGNKDDKTEGCQDSDMPAPTDSMLRTHTSNPNDGSKRDARERDMAEALAKYNAMKKLQADLQAEKRGTSQMGATEDHAPGTEFPLKGEQSREAKAQDMFRRAKAKAAKEEDVVETSGALDEVNVGGGGAKKTDAGLSKKRVSGKTMGYTAATKPFTNRQEENIGADKEAITSRAAEWGEPKGWATGSDDDDDDGSADSDGYDDEAQYGKATGAGWL